jgi:hypothetical protein
MATVRFSELLKSDIERNAKNVFKERIIQAKQNTPASWNAEYLYNTIFSKDIRDKMNALPDKFLETQTNISLNGFHDVPRDEKHNHKNEFWNVHDSIALEFSVPHRFPHGSEFPDWKKNWRSMTLKYNAPRFATIQAEWETWMQGVNAIKDKRKEFVKGINKITSTYATLSPALKAFPALWDLVPEQYRERHLEIVTRKKGNPQELGDLDVNALTSEVTLSKLTR